MEFLPDGDRYPATIEGRFCQFPGSKIAEYQDLLPFINRLETEFHGLFGIIEVDGLQPEFPGTLQTGQGSIGSCQDPVVSPSWPFCKTEDQGVVGVHFHRGLAGKADDPCLTGRNPAIPGFSSRFVATGKSQAA